MEDDRAPVVEPLPLPPSARSRKLALLELVAVSALAFGLPILRSLHAMFAPADVAIPVDDRALLAALGEELAVLLAIGAGLLAFRRRRLADFRPTVTWRLTLFGVGLYLLVAVLERTPLFTLLPQGRPWDAQALTPGVAIAFSLVNGAWEEVLLLGYLFRAAEGLWSVRMAFLLTLGVRIAYHTYQGLAGVLWVTLFGLLLGGAYFSCRKVWPAVVAHVLADVVGLLWLLA